MPACLIDFQNSQKSRETYCEFLESQKVLHIFISGLGAASFSEKTGDFEVKRRDFLKKEDGEPDIINSWCMIFWTDEV